MEKKENQNEIYRKISDEKINEIMAITAESAKRGMLKYPGIIKGFLNNLKGKTTESLIETLSVVVNLFTYKELLALSQSLNRIAVSETLVEIFKEKDVDKKPDNRKDAMDDPLLNLLSDIFMK